MSVAYGLAGFVNVPPPVITGFGPPPASFVGLLGQSYFDKSTTPFTEYVYNGSLWELGGASGANTFDGNTGTAIPAGGIINILGTSGITTSASGNTVTITSDVGGFPITPYVVGPLGFAGYQTVQSALNAANAAGGGIVYVQPGTYTENLTLFGNTQVVGVAGNSDAGTAGNTVIISGVHTPPATGFFGFINIRLVSATHVFSSAVAGSASLVIENSFIVITNGFLFNLPNWTGQLITYNTGDGSTNNGMVNNSGGSTCFFVSATHGAGTGQTMVTSGTVQLENIVLNCPWNAQTGSVINSAYNIYTHTVTCSNNSTGTFKYDSFSTGATPCLTQSSSGAISLTNCYINSSNNPAISGAGAGVLTITNSPFINNKLTATTLTLASNVIQGGNFLSQYVVATDGSAPYKVIQTAINDAQAYFTATSIPQTVYIKPGVYTENLTLKVGVDLCAAGGQVDSKFTNIVGTHALPTASGSTAIYGLWFTGTTACFTGSSGNTKVNMFNVITEITGVGYTFDVTGFAGELNIFDYLQFDTGTNGFVNNPTGGAEVNIIFAGVGLSQNLSATAQISGNSFFQGMLVSINMNFVGTSSTQINMGCELQGTISTADSASVDIANTYCFVRTAKAINHLSSGTVTLSNVGINSSNGTPIDGTGTIKIANVSFVNSSTIANTLTKTWGAMATGALSMSGNLTLLNAGNKLISSSVGTVAAAGANSFGTVTLVGGTATVSTTSIDVNSFVVLWRQSIGLTGAAALGLLACGTITAGTSFVINALQAADATALQASDVSVVGWMIIN